MDELKKLLENAGIQEITIDPITNRAVNTNQVSDNDEPIEVSEEFLNQTFRAIEELVAMAGEGSNPHQYAEPVAHAIANYLREDGDLPN